jgi:glutathione synthase/RimK-type ligase-like ATP-grasp enzyme
MIENFKNSLVGRRLYRTRWFWVARNALRSLVKKNPAAFSVIDDRGELDVAPRVLMPWPLDIQKPKIGLVQDMCNPPYWTKYERFLQNNRFSFEYYDAHCSGWLAASETFDVIVWATEGKSPQIKEQKRKTYMLEKHSGKICFPSYDTLMWHEDKIFQYEWLRKRGFPVIDTFISHSAPEALSRIKDAGYPLVSKQPVGAGSLGVELVRNIRQAEKIVRQSFSAAGRQTYWPYARQKDYVFFQTFQPNEGYDLRVIVVGNKAFGYFRDVPPGEYRASGMGLVRKESLPEDAVRLAVRVARSMDLVVVAVDMLRDTRGVFQIIEMSAFIQVDTAGQLHVDNEPGAYVVDASGEYRFEPGRFWIQELALKEFFERLLRRKRSLQSDCAAS